MTLSPTPYRRPADHRQLSGTSFGKGQIYSLLLLHPPKKKTLRSHNGWQLIEVKLFASLFCTSALTFVGLANCRIGKRKKSCLCKVLTRCYSQVTLAGGRLLSLRVQRVSNLWINPGVGLNWELYVLINPCYSFCQGSSFWSGLQK